MAQNATLIANSALGGNIVTILVRQLLKAKARQSAAQFRAKVASLQQQGGEIEYIPPEVGLVGIPITVKKQEAYAFRADITQHALESGANVTDHVILYPAIVDISFEITNFDMARPKEAHTLFQRLYSDRIPSALQTEHGVLENMILTAYRAENSVPNWGALDCKATFTQIKYVQIEAIRLTEDQTTQTGNTGGPDSAKSAQAPVKTGRQVPQDTLPNQTAQAH